MPVITSNMNLTLPGVGTEPGPDWASELNADLSLIDAHSHAPGYGVQITPDGININTDLSMASNNLILARSLRLDAQSMPVGEASDLGCLYESGVDLYFNDGNGNQVRITQSGGVAGTPGSISNLVSPASATYVPATPAFVWESDANTPANMDAASYIFRNLSANSFGLTLQPPNSMAANYALTLPQLPVSQKFMTLDAAGTISAPWAVDNSTIEVNSNVVRVKDDGITYQKLGTYNYTLSSGTGLVTINSTSYVNVTALTGSITTTNNRPIRVEMVPVNGSGTVSTISQGSSVADIALYRDGVQISHFTNSSSVVAAFWPGPLTVDFLSPGTYTYQVKAKVSASSLTIDDVKLLISQS